MSVRHIRYEREPGEQQARPASNLVYYGIHEWSVLDPEGLIVTAAEQADCNCPDVCERDHERD